MGLARALAPPAHTHPPQHTHTRHGAGPSRVMTLRSLSTKTDYLSLQAFATGVRKSAWNATFDSFLPLVSTYWRAALVYSTQAVQDST